MGVAARRVRDHPELMMQAMAGSSLFGLSAIAHLFAPVSPQLNASLFRIDRCGISFTETCIGICGALIHYRGAGDATRRRLLILLNLFIGACSLKLLWNPAALQNKSIKIGVLSAQALICYLPAWLARRASGQRDPKLHALLGSYAAWAGGSAGVGALMYGFGFPEKLIYRAEAQENQRRECASQLHSSDAQNSATPINSPTIVASPPSPSCCSASRPLLPSHLLRSPWWRALHWLTSHLLHSHHLMHWAVALAVWMAFKGSWEWKMKKVAREVQERAQAGAASAIKAAIESL